MGAEIDYNELFGLNETGAEVAEPADPPGETEVEGAEAGDLAEPSEENTQQPGTGEGTGEENETGNDGAQPPEDRARFAAARRRAEAERDAEVARVRQEEQEKYERAMKEFFSKAGLKNTITGEPITNMEQFDAWNKKFADEKLKRDLKAGKLTAEQIQQVVENSPVIQQAQQVIRQSEQTQKAAREQQIRDTIDNQVKAISQLDPDIKDLESLFKSEGYDKVYALVQKGYALDDAYKLVHFDRLNQRSVAAARQQAMNSAAGKSHMTKTPARGAAPEYVKVPDDVMAHYKLLMPDASDAEIRAHYAKSHRK